MKTLQEVYAAYSMPESGGDKGTAHSYIEIYGSQILPENGKSLLEIGIWEGHSIKMWEEYLPDGRIVGLDKDLSKISMVFDRAEIIKCDATDSNQVAELIAGSFDYIIDDGSHAKEEQIAGLRNLWALLKPNGKYFIEDVFSIEIAEELAAEISEFTGCEVLIYDRRSVKGRYDDILLQINRLEEAYSK